MSNYAIGDIQGCYKEFKQLLRLIKFDQKEDRLWLCGDLINRGPDSLKTLNLIYSLRKNCYITLGNHDLHFLAVAMGYRKLNKSDTFMDLLESTEKSIFVNWLRKLPLYQLKEIAIGGKKEQFLMTHAGMPPHWEIRELILRSKELSKSLRSDQGSEIIFKNMYLNRVKGKKEDNAILRKIETINYLTRMRFCDKNGKLDLSTKGPPQEAKKGYMPWFEHSLKVNESKTKILFGHWAALKGITNKKNIIALDTGCVWGYKLTAYKLEDSRVFSVNRLN